MMEKDKLPAHTCKHDGDIGGFKATLHNLVVTLTELKETSRQSLELNKSQAIQGEALRSILTRVGKAEIDIDAIAARVRDLELKEVAEKATAAEAGKKTSLDRAFTNGVKIMLVGAAIIGAFRFYLDIRTYYDGQKPAKGTINISGKP